MRPTRVEIDLAAIRHNIRQLRNAILPAASLTAVVKANAYGHGAVKVSEAALDAGADSLAVAIPEEGAELRKAGVSAPIILLGLTLPEQAPLIIENNLTASVATADALDALAEAARAGNRRACIMAKIDTGMSRIGVTAADSLNFIREILARPELEFKGIFTHLATADAYDKSYANSQLDRFKSVLNQLSQANIDLPYVSAANSAAAIDLKAAHFSAVRPGIAMYGLPPSDELHVRLDLQPAMQFKTKIVFIKHVPAGTPVGYGCTYTTPRPTYLATLPVGYADGYSRRLSNCAAVLIGGKRRPVVGRVCMDQIIVDVGPTCDVNIGDEAVLFGSQGREEITVTELAGLAGTINYELVCAISARVPRVYLNE